MALKGLIDFYHTRQRLDIIFYRLHSKAIPDREWLRARVLVKDCLRWRRHLDRHINHFSRKPAAKLPLNLRSLAQILVYEVLMDDGVPAYAAVDEAVNLARKKISRKAAGFINALGRSLERSAIEFPVGSVAQKESFPDWMVNRWKTFWGAEEAKLICQHLNSGTGTVIRRNPSMINEADLIDDIQAIGGQLDRMPATDIFYRVTGTPSGLRTLPRFLDGSFSLQGRGAGAVVELLNPQPGETILDVCAAPGTKTRYMAELMRGEGTIFASDISSERISTAQKDDRRHPARNIEWSVKNAQEDTFPLAEAILIDAPCTGTGVIGKHPEIKWRRRPGDVQKFQEIQIGILTHMMKFLKPGGRIVYATCSLEKEENWDVVDAVLKLTKHFEVESPRDQFPAHWMDKRGALHTRPVHESIDGLFGVILRKKS
ncbi:MAG: methyltransferase domain-containing protein [FCB group bacterium]|nr:methyltransferase domain-containing protein [FCB group bacterium]